MNRRLMGLQGREMVVFMGRGLAAMVAVGIVLVAMTGARGGVATSRPVGATTRPVDRSTPRAGLMAYFEATYRKDSRGATALCYAKDEDERELALAMSMYGVTEEQFREVVWLTGGDPAISQLAAPRITEEELDKGSVEMINSDTARVYSERKADWPMVRVDGQWCLAVGMCAREQHLSEREMELGMMELAKRNMEVIRNLMAGKRAEVGAIKGYLEEGRGVDWE